MGDDINDSLEEVFHVDVIAPGGISNPFKFASTAYVFEGDKDKFSKPLFHTQKEVEQTEEEVPFGFIGFKFPLSAMFAKWYADCFYHYYYIFDIVKYGGVKIGLSSILVRYKGRSHIVDRAAVPSFA